MVQKQMRGKLWIIAFALFALSACKNSARESQSQGAKSIEERRLQTCLDKVERSTKKWEYALETSYAKRDPHAKKISQSDKTIFLRGAPGKGAVLLMHGILSSPNAMR